MVTRREWLGGIAAAGCTLSGLNAAGSVVSSTLSGEDKPAEPKVENLWPKEAPGATGTEPADTPTLTISLPEKETATGVGIVICPGGGYGGLAVNHEGYDIIKWLNSKGIAAFMLKYRHAPKYKHPAPLQDAQRALRTVRARAGEFGIDAAKIGILGFSAGGHLTSTAGTHFDAGKPDSEDPIERVSCRPDFLVLCYPVIAFDQPYTHRGSQHNLIGKDAPAELVELLSNERQVTKETPPTFLFHTTEDAAVPPENSVVFYSALRKNSVPCEMHIYEKGRHGVGLASDNPALATWPELCIHWLKTRGLIKS